jgi:hypothetical protein
MGEKKQNKERQDYIKNLIFESGSFVKLKRKTIEELSRKFNCSCRIIYEDIKKAMTDLPLPKVQSFLGRMHSALILALKGANEMALSAFPNVKKDGINAIYKGAEIYTKFMEDFGIKEKIADKIEVDNNFITPPSMLKLIEQAKEKVKKKNEKRKSKKKV